MYDISYQFVIDTNSYAGNFERELCAYCTGYWDNETHGETQANIFKEEVGDPEEIFDNITYAMNEHGMLTPNTIEIEPTTNKYNSVAIFFDKEPTPKQIETIKQRAEKFSKEGKIFDHSVNLKILGYRLMQKISEIKTKKV